MRCWVWYGTWSMEHGVRDMGLETWGQRHGVRDIGYHYRTWAQGMKYRTWVREHNVECGMEDGVVGDME